MSLTLAAVGAVVAAVLQLTIVPYLGIAGAYPDLLLVIAVIATFAWSTEAGMTLAFVGGLMIDLLAPRPIGLTAFTLLLSTGIAAVIGRVVQRGRVLTPIVLIFALSFVTDLTFLGLFTALEGKLAVPDPIQLILPGAIYSTAIALVLSPAAMAINKRFTERERVAW
ncbi:MAG TPA: rod shape-determining protein MreD [Candidatus Limnocylindrales bacterium]|nr:rod shape-determining protein MreD [Candidatus Limnocylindrales bacterium]